MFRDKVYEVVRAIPKGQTRTYKQVVEAAGYPKAYRAVGSLMSHNYDPEIPCHRVLRSDGGIGNYNRGGPDKKRQILLSEGVKL